jgi:predicted nucleotidyltransferase
MTTKKSIEVGAPVEVSFDTLRVLCVVLDSRRSYGRTDVCVEPVAGSGKIWVDVKRVFVV